jgi:hypothetical protein
MTHLCLVSDQPIPNLLPVLQPDTRPDRVVLAVSDRMREKAEWLAGQIRCRQIAVDYLPLADAFEIVSLQDAFLGWLTAHETEDVALNVTGGTKPMAIAAQEAFRCVEKPVFYVNVETDNLVWIDRNRPPVKMVAGVPLKTFFAVHGIKLTAGQTHARLSPEWETFCLELGLVKASPWEQALGKLNYHAMEAERHDVLDVGRVYPDGCKYWTELMESLYHNDIIRDPLRLHFKSPEARAFANGGWMEHLVYEAVKKLDAVTDPILNAQVVDARDNQNEMDVVFLSRNRLFIVECKTKRLDQNQTPHGPAADAIYKLDALRKAGGLRTRGVLVSFRPVPDVHKRRAQEAGISVIDQQGLPRLQELLTAAIK